MSVRTRGRVRNQPRFNRNAPLLAATAILAAAVGDAVVETIARTGVFGSGSIDADQSSVLPVCLTGLLIALVVFSARSLQEWRLTARRRSERLSFDLAHDGSERAGRLPFATVFGLQLLIVFAMQTCEQLFASGRFVDGNAWLGGPAWFSLLVHGAICVLSTALLRRSMRAFVSRVVDILREGERFLNSRAFECVCNTVGRSVPSRVFLALEPGVRRTRGRAPPLRKLAST